MAIRITGDAFESYFRGVLNRRLSECWGESSAFFYL
jgi:hypothetical protein